MTNNIRIDETTGNPLCNDCGHHIGNHIQGCAYCGCTMSFSVQEETQAKSCPHLQQVIDVLVKNEIKERRDDPYESVELVCEKCNNAVWVSEIIKEKPY